MRSCRLRLIWNSKTLFMFSKFLLLVAVSVQGWKIARVNQFLVTKKLESIILRVGQQRRSRRKAEVFVCKLYRGFNRVNMRGRM
ncbi:unnamed protein product [Brugia timori]|uniref:Secreted protein n=1 Tax=Brugia timori TaxID=42155 RepID=A0A0R3QUF7_9BILA|nr:unnamed protein product [Brugia timori]